MPIKIGEIDVTAVKLGGIDVTAVMLGGQDVYSGNMIRDKFDRLDSIGLGPNWVDHGPAAEPFVASVANGTCRINLPSDSTTTVVSSQRYGVAKCAADDGYVQTRPITEGSRGGYPTYILRRLTDAAFTDGVGVALDDGTLSIVRLLSSTYVVQAACGGFMGGDTVRLQQAGNTHTLLLNGTDVGEWNDISGSAHSGAGYQSAGLVVSGRYFTDNKTDYSPSLDYFEFT